MKKYLNLFLFLTITFLLTGCSKEIEYNYNRDDVKLIANYELLTENYNEQIRTAYFFPNKEFSDKQTYLYVMRQDDIEEYSLDSASDYLASIRTILESNYQLSKKQNIDKDKKNNQIICTNDYSAMDKDEEIYQIRTKYINEDSHGLMVVCVINDKESKEIKNAYNELFESIILELKEKEEG